MADRTVTVGLRMQMRGAITAVRNYRSEWQQTRAELKKNALAHREAITHLSDTAAVAGGVLVAGVGLAIAKWAEFDAQMSNVGAVMKTTEANMDALRQAALDAGATTVFSATEAAQAIEELGKAGVSTEDILSGGLRGALSLATAGQLDVAEAAEVAALAMQQFGLSGDQIPHVADLLAAAAGKSLGSVHDLGMGLQQSGLVLNQFGVSIEEGVAGLAAFAKAGLIGSDAGTSLKTMLMMLSAPTAKSAGLMRELGIEAYDASGQFIGLTALAAELQDSLSGLTQEQRDAALATIFGTDAVRGANVLYQEGADGIMAWRAAVDDAGYASEVAADRLDNLAGDAEQFGGALDTALIKTGSGANDALRLLVQSGTEMVNVFSSLPGPVQTTGLAIAGVGGASLLAVGGLGRMIVSAAETREALKEMRVSGGRAQRMMGRMAKGAGILGGAFAVLAVANAATNRKISYDLDELTETLIEFERTGTVTGQTARLWGDDLEHLSYDVRVLGDDWDAVTNNAIDAAVEWVSLKNSWSDETTDQARERITALDESLAQMVSSGNTAEAASLMDEVEARAAELGISVDELANDFPLYQAALDAANRAAEESEESQAVLQNALSITTGSMDTAVEAAGGLKEALELLNGGAIGVDEAIIKTEDSITAFTTGIAEARSESEDWTLQLGLNTEEGRRNREAIIDIAQAAQDAAQATYEETGSVDAATATYQYYRDELARVLHWAGLNEEQAAELIDRYMGMPGSVYTDIDSDADREREKVEFFSDQILNIPDGYAEIHTNYTYSGYKPAAGSKYSVPVFGRGGEVSSPTLAMLAEEGYGETIISHNPAYRSRSLGLYAELGRTLGVRPDAPASAASAASPRSSGGSVMVWFDFANVSGPMERAIRDTVRIKGGGNVQAAFGSR